MKKMLNKEKIILLHTVWMQNYAGYEDDIGAGGFDYAQEHGFGYELLNFQNSSGSYYGYVQATNGTINIDWLGAKPTDKYIDDILIIWTAPHPDGDGRFVVGWYKNARVFRKKRKPEPNLKRRFLEQDICYNVTAAAEDCKLLPIDQRTLRIPSNGKGLPGQSSCFFPANSKDPEKTEKIVQKALAFIEGYSGNTPTGSTRENRNWRQTDACHRKEVETAAITAITARYNSLGYNVRSVEAESCGWDLEADKDDKSLCIEVKGRASNSTLVELTPNEYEKLQMVEDSEFNRKFKSGYRLAIVSNACSADQKLCIFSYVPKRKIWHEAESKKQLKITPKTGAKVEIKSD